MAFLLWSCANIGRPSGGDKDTKGPEVIGVLPYPGTLFFNYREIVFHFDEFIKPGNYKKEIFISPVPAIDPVISVKNKTLTIKFLGPLRENTTYVITLGTGIADFNESNKMVKSYTYAFSTGAVLDSLKFSGRVNDMWSGAPEKEMKLLLFHAEDIEDNNIIGRRPEYLVTTGKEGEFDFRFLAPGHYAVYGVVDANNDNKFSGPNEKIALAKDPLVILTGGDTTDIKVVMTSFMLDEKGPTVKNAKWSNDYTIHVEFSESIRSRFGNDSLRVELIDSAAKTSQYLDVFRFKGKDKSHLYLNATLPRNHAYSLKFNNLMDSLGHKGDTLIGLDPMAAVKEERNRWYDTPENLRRGHEFVVSTYFALPERLDSTEVVLLDSAGTMQSLQWRTDGMQLYGKPSLLLDPSQTYRIQLKKEMPLPTGKSIDTLVNIPVRFPNPNDFGTVTGKVLPDSSRPDARFVIILRGPQGSGLLIQPKAEKELKGKSAASTSGAPDRFEARFSAPGSFRFVYLMEGKYTIDVIEDADGNGVATPGSLSPYRLPEKVFHQSAPIEIKAKWDVEDLEIYPIPAVGKSKESKAAAGKGK
jgi:uncharacterized protein (DUF2141 family)